MLPEAQAPQLDHNVHDGGPTMEGGAYHLPGSRDVSRVAFHVSGSPTGRFDGGRGPPRRPKSNQPPVIERAKEGATGLRLLLAAYPTVELVGRWQDCFSHGEARRLQCGARTICKWEVNQSVESTAWTNLTKR